MSDGSLSVPISCLNMSHRSPVSQQEHGDASRGRRQRGVHGHLCRQGAAAAGLHGQRGTRVEAVPAEPQGERQKRET